MHTEKNLVSFFIRESEEEWRRPFEFKEKVLVVVRCIKDALIDSQMHLLQFPNTFALLSRVLICCPLTIFFIDEILVKNLDIAKSYFTFQKF